MSRIDYELTHKKVKLDKRDKDILKLLAEDARMPLTKISKYVKLSRDSVDYRIKRLEKEGIILKTFANLNFMKLGYYIFHVFFLIDENNKERQNDFLKYLTEHENIFSVIEYNDRWDIEAVMVAKNLRNFDKIMLEISSKFPNLILEKDKAEIIQRYNANYLPIHKNNILIQDDEFASFPDLDEKDYKILKLLSNDARMSTYDIGKKVSLSADAVRYRIKKYLDEKIIYNFTVLVNFSLLHYHWYTFSMEVKTFDKTYEKKFEEFLRQNPNIIRSAKTLGGWDVLLYIVAENPREFHHIIKEIKRVFSNVIRNYQTWLAYHEHNIKTMPEVISRTKL